jgi:drug/metabolite transporter (DMT)-like permease
MVPLLGSLLLQQSLPSTVQMFGIACAVTAGAIVYGFGPIGPRSGLVPSLAAAILLGAWFVLIEQGATDSAAWSIASARAVGAITMLTTASARGTWAQVGPNWRPATAAGLLDTAGTILIVFAVGEVHIVAVAALAGLYPLSTIALARIVLGERLPWSGRLGAGAAVVGIALISAGA